MKDEEMAEEYIEKNCKIWEEGELTVDEIVRLTFLAGLKAGRPQWHDLQENANDLPERISTLSKTVINQIGTPCHYNYDLECWQNWSYIEIETPIAWCELSTFDKE